MADEKDEIYLSSGQIREWQIEYETLGNELVQLMEQAKVINQRQQSVNQKIQSLAHKIRLAVPFAPALAEWLEEQNFNQSAETLALPDAILKVMIRAFPMNPHVPLNMIQSQLPQFGYPPQKLHATPNYLGIALKRLVARSLLVEPVKGQYGLTQAGRAYAQQLR